MMHPTWEGAGEAPSPVVPIARSRSRQCTFFGSSRFRGLARWHQRRCRDLFATRRDLIIVCVDDLIGNLTQTLAQAFAVMLQQFEGLVKPHHCRGEPPVQLLLESATLFQGVIVFEFRWPAVYDLVDIFNRGIETVFEMNQLGDVGGLERHRLRLLPYEVFLSSILRLMSLLLKRQALLMPPLDA